MRLIFVLLVASACSARHGAPVGPGARAGSASGSTAPSAPSGPIVVTDADGARTSVGKRVAVHGTARDAKLGAAILNRGFVVYCLGVDRWPADVHGRAITGRGTLEETAAYAAPGADRAGTQGPVWVLRECEYEPVP